MTTTPATGGDFVTLPNIESGSGNGVGNSYPTPVPGSMGGYAPLQEFPLAYEDPMEAQLEQSVFSAPPTDKRRLKDRVIDFVKGAIDQGTDQLQQAVMELTQRLDDAEREREKLAATLNNVTQDINTNSGQIQTMQGIPATVTAYQPENAKTSQVQNFVGNTQVATTTEPTQQSESIHSISSSHVQPVDRNEHNFVSLLGEFTMERRRHARQLEELQTELARVRMERDDLKGEVTRQLDIAYVETRAFANRLTEEMRVVHESKVSDLESQIEKLKKKLKKARGKH